MTTEEVSPTSSYIILPPVSEKEAVFGPRDSCDLNLDIVLVKIEGADDVVGGDGVGVPAHHTRTFEGYPEKFSMNSLQHLV